MDARDARGTGRAAREGPRRRAPFPVGQAGVARAAAARAVGARRRTPGAGATAGPAVAGRAGAARAAIRRGEGTGTSDRDRTGRSCAPRGRTPVLARTAGRIARGTVSAAGDRGPMRLMPYEGALNAAGLVAL